MSSSDDEDDIFTTLSKIAVLAGKEQTLKNSQIHDDPDLIKIKSVYENGFFNYELFLLGPYYKLTTLRSWISSLPYSIKPVFERLANLVALFRDGRYLSILHDNTIYENLFSKKDASVMGPKDQILKEQDIHISCTVLQDKVAKYASEVVDGSVGTGSITEDTSLLGYWVKQIYARARAFELLVVGASCLNVYVQANWTGPPVNLSKGFNPLPLQQCNPTSDHVESIESWRCLIRNILGMEGYNLFSYCQLPEYLLCANIVLQAFDNSQSMHLGWKVNPSRGFHKQDEKFAMMKTAAHSFTTRPWWCGRATVIHHRSLITGLEGCYLMKTITAKQFKVAIQNFRAEIGRETEESNVSTVFSQLFLEWGLAQHYYNDSDGGKTSIRQAQLKRKLSVNLTGSMGLRGIWQEKKTEQMVVKAESSLSAFSDDKEKLLCDSREDELAAAGVKEILLSEVDDNTNLREHIEFTEENVYKADLEIIDQAIILGLCVDVKNTNPRDGLTNEQMAAYIARVMATQNNRNWMVHSSALVLKALVEFERWKTKERSVLQLQALVDQHIGRLSPGQLATTDVCAPCSERMALIYAVSMPPIWTLKRELADRYMEIHVKQSALEIYRELELWEDVVQCLLDTQKDKEALDIVQNRLQVRPSPMLWCCLGELENEDLHFEKAWALSNGRYARAMRLLGKRYFQRCEWKKANKCYLASLSVRPQEHHAWWRVGTAAMRIEDWGVALRAWTNCARLEPSDGEAWGNMGAVFCHLNRLEEAYNAFEQGLKHQRQNWKMWENFLVLSVRTKRYGRALYAQEQLLSLRHKRIEKSGKNNSPLDLESLNVLTNIIVKSLASDGNPDILNDLTDAEQDKMVDNFNKKASVYAPRLQKVFESATSSISTSPVIWALYAELCIALGNLEINF